MAQASPKTRNLSASFWGLLFAVCLALVVAQLVTATQGQMQQQEGLIESTFTRAPALAPPRRATTSRPTGTSV